MNHKRLKNYLLISLIVLLFQGSIQAQDSKTLESNVPGEDVVLQWNRVLQETIRTPGLHPATIFPVRSFAMMHAAMFDAVNSIDGTYTPYLVDIPSNRFASQEAAVAQAAHDVLVGLYPSRKEIFDEELNTSLIGIPSNRMRQGIKVGRIAAETLLSFRSNDGWNVTPPPFVLPPTPGNWQPTPPNFPTAAFTQYPAVITFAIGTSSRFTPNPPPAMTSEEYTRDFNEVKELGSATSSTRTAEQTKIAQLWANVNTPTTALFVWNTVARTVSISRNNTTAENARLFALLNIAHHDALQTSMTSKFVFGLWRPVTAIRRADEDSNPNTTQDLNWSSLITTPPYPSYAGNMATIGTSQATILALFFGRDDIIYQHTWEGAGGATRSYAGFNVMADEQDRARVYGGIHFPFDNVAGQSAGRNVANYVFLNFMKPRN